MSRPSAAALAAVLALSAPAGALAQSAGDDQYRDPFADENGSQQEGSGGGGDDTGGGSTPTPAPAPSSGTAVEPTATTAGTLPRTGLGAGWVTIAGLGLIVAGAGLRRTVRA
jgi:LPXTG-motif cell wall-anchored protein